MAPRYIRLRVPRMPAGLAANLLGLAGLVALAVAVGALAGSWWWSVGLGGVFAVGLSWMASTDEPSAHAGATDSSNVHQLGPAGARSA